MKKVFKANYSQTVLRAVRNPQCKIKTLENYAFVKCNFPEKKAYFIQKKGSSAEGFLLESRNEELFFKKLYSLFHPNSINLYLYDS